MYTVHLIYGLSPAREQFIHLINAGSNTWQHMGFDYTHFPVLTDQLVPNCEERTQQQKDKKLQIMLNITSSWGNEAHRRTLLGHIQDVLTEHLIAAADKHSKPSYLPTTTAYSDWERILEENDSSMFVKKKNYFSRKCKTGLRMPHTQFADPPSVLDFQLGDTIFLVNGLDMV